MRSDEPVDAVLLWVDGNDPVLNAKRREWAPEGALSLDDQAGKTRYADCGEIHYCIRSIRKFAPWIRRIYVVTDGQDPQVEPGAIPVEVVDHSAIFAGYESFLPVFNSIAIETMYWRIPGLSRRFVYFNDDFFLARPVEPSDFFTEDGVIAYARPFSVPYEALLRRLRYDPEHTHFSFRGVMLNTARLMGEKRRFFRYNHTPRGLLRDYYEEAFAARKDLLEKNISCRFRDPGQFSVEEMIYLSEAAAGTLEVRPFRKDLYFWQCREGKGLREVHRPQFPGQTAGGGACRGIRLPGRNPQSLPVVTRQLSSFSPDPSGRTVTRYRWFLATSKLSRLPPR